MLPFTARFMHRAAVPQTVRRNTVFQIMFFNNVLKSIDTWTKIIDNEKGNRWYGHKSYHSFEIIL